MATFKDINLQVGTRVQMSLRQGAQQLVYYTELIGYLEGEYLIVKTPVENGLTVRMQVDEQVILRIFSGLNVFTFNCNVKTIFRSPHFYVHLSFPNDIKIKALRSAIRARVDLPVQINGVSRAGVITDISVTGAAIVADSELGVCDEKIAISFTFPIQPTNQSAQIETSATICSIQLLPDKKKIAVPRFSHGISFHEIDSTSQAMLLNLVYESLHG